MESLPVSRETTKGTSKNTKAESALSNYNDSAENMVRVNGKGKELLPQVKRTKHPKHKVIARDRYDIDKHIRKKSAEEEIYNCGDDADDIVDDSDVDVDGDVPSSPSHVHSTEEEEEEQNNNLNNQAPHHHHHHNSQSQIVTPEENEHMRLRNSGGSRKQAIRNEEEDISQPAIGDIMPSTTPPLHSLSTNVVQAAANVVEESARSSASVAVNSFLKFSIQNILQVCTKFIIIGVY